VAAPAQITLRPGQPVKVRFTVVGDNFTGGLVTGPPWVAVRFLGGVKAIIDAVSVTAPPGAPPHSGRLFVPRAGIAVPLQILAAQPPAPPIGALRVLTRKGRPIGVRFVAGAISRARQGTGILPVGNLTLTLEGPGRRELTPPGGARDLLPSEYEYALTNEVLGALPPGRYRFVARARGPAGGSPVVRRSRSFRIG
jgi:hypothetical protein